MTSNKNQKFYKVTMQVEVVRTVMAISEEEAREKVDTSDMIYEIKNYKFDETLYVKEINNRTPDDYDRIEDIGEQIVLNSYDPMHMLKEKYAEIQKINQQLIQSGKQPYEPQAFRRMTDEYLDRLRNY